MQLHHQSQLNQPSTARTPYHTPKLTLHGRLASIVEGGVTAGGVESGTDTNSVTV